jgi:hypothetical protein
MARPPIPGPERLARAPTCEDDVFKIGIESWAASSDLRLSGMDVPISGIRLSGWLAMKNSKVSAFTNPLVANLAKLKALQLRLLFCRTVTGQSSGQLHHSVDQAS